MHDPYHDSNARIARILPHSFELLALFLTGGLSFYFVWSIFMLIYHRSYNISVIYETIILIFVSALIILIAAFVETYISFSI